MSDTELLDKFRHQGLLPFQANFASSVLLEEQPAVMLLQGPVGSGVTHTICHAIGEGVSTGSFNRVLCLTPAALAYAMRERVKDCLTGAPVFNVDRKVLREFEAAAPVNADMWPDRGVFVTTLDFAKRPEVAGHFVNTGWDLVVFDEAHFLVNPSSRQDFFKSLLTTHESKIILANHVPAARLDDLVTQLAPSRAIRSTVWKTQELRNWDGQPFGQKAIEWQIVRYDMHESEAAFYEKLQETARALDHLVGANSLLQQSLMNRAMSCLYSVEEALMEQRNKIRRLRNNLLHGVGPSVQQQTLFDVETEEPQPMLFDEAPEDTAVLLEEYENAVSLVDDALLQFEELETDSKSEAAVGLLEELSSGNTCVLSQYNGTISYLQTTLAERDSLCPIVLSGHTQAGELEHSVSEYKSVGGLLLATDAVLRGFELPEMDNVIHYDLPMTPERMYFRISRFNRIGRQGIVKMIGLVEANAVTGRLWEKMLAVARDFGLNDED